jgi:hypothetical protein
MGLPENIAKRVGEELPLDLTKFKELSKQGFDLWGDNISTDSPTLLTLDMLSDLMRYVQD